MANKISRKRNRYSVKNKSIKKRKNKKSLKKKIKRTSRKKTYKLKKKGGSQQPIKENIIKTINIKPTYKILNDIYLELGEQSGNSIHYIDINNKIIHNFSHNGKSLEIVIENIDGQYKAFNYKSDYENNSKEKLDCFKHNNLMLKFKLMLKNKKPYTYNDKDHKICNLYMKFNNINEFLDFIKKNEIKHEGTENSFYIKKIKKTDLIKDGNIYDVSKLNTDGSIGRNFLGWGGTKKKEIYKAYQKRIDDYYTKGTPLPVWKDDDDFFKKYGKMLNKLVSVTPILNDKVEFI